MVSHAETERQAVAALHPDRDRLDRLARERRADVERIAEAIYSQNCKALEGEPDGTASHQEHVEHGIWMAFWRAELFVAERDRRREK